MKILVSGSSGFVGTALCASLRREGHTLGRLTRSGSITASGYADEAIRWEPPTGSLDLAAMEAADAVVHLAGASIASGRWTQAKKELLRASRIDSTRHLVGGIAKLKHKPRVFICASAIGYYGDRGHEILTESSAPGNDFLSRLCVEWEAAASEAERIGIRVVMLRFGIILDAHGGALPRILLPFRFGAGGRLGSGKQWMSWIALEDVVAIIHHAIGNDSLRGPMDTVSPNPITNIEFTKIVAKVLHRPALFPAPRFALRLALGEMADALLFSSQRVIPEKLAELRYSFRHPDLQEALRSILR
ncbi:MAG TPA: TIGR01777 family oxidoreductase [Candidatus Acidoferrales bacterium]|nr:TIGR01777 family oxidoreductase [Candidatus Acidoferrales bacterium]